MEATTTTGISIILFFLCSSMEFLDVNQFLLCCCIQGPAKTNLMDFESNWSGFLVIKGGSGTGSYVNN
jgi:hypothetical protein